MCQNSSQFGPLDEVLGTLLETWSHRYRFEFDRQERLIIFSNQTGMQVVAKELPDGRVRVSYEWALHETAEEICSPGQAVQFIRLLLLRERLSRVPIPPDSLA